MKDTQSLLVCCAAYCLLLVTWWDPNSVPSPRFGGTSPLAHFPDGAGLYGWPLACVARRLFGRGARGENQERRSGVGAARGTWTNEAIIRTVVREWGWARRIVKLCGTHGWRGDSTLHFRTRNKRRGRLPACTQPIRAIYSGPKP